MVTYQTTFNEYLRNLLSFFDFFTQSYNYGFYGLSWRRGWEEYDRYFFKFFYGLMFLKNILSVGLLRRDVSGTRDARLMRRWQPDNQ